MMMARLKRTVLRPRFLRKFTVLSGLLAALFSLFLLVQPAQAATFTISNPTGISSTYGDLTKTFSVSISTPSQGTINGTVTITLNSTGATLGSCTVSASKGTNVTNASCAANQKTPPVGASQQINFTYSDGTNTANTATSTWTVTAATLTVTAQNKSTTFGSAAPAFTTSYSGLVNGDAAPAGYVAPSSCSSTYVVGATASGNVGTYPITCTGGSATNYTISNTAGTLTVGKKDMHIDAASHSITFGDPNPTYDFTYRAADFASFETSGSTSFTTKISQAPTCSSGYSFGNTTAGNAGTYPISCVLSNAATSPSLSTNYNFVAGNAADVTVAKKDLHVDPTAFSITYGATNPVTADYAFTYRAADFASFETSSSTSFTGKISVAPTCGSDYSKGATGNGVVGAYAITCTTYATTPTPPASTNYRFVAGSAANLTVNKKQLRVDAQPLGITYGAAAPATSAFTFVYRSGDFVNTEDQSASSFTSSITTAPYCGSNYVATADGRGDAGSYTISCTVTGSEAANYDFVAGNTNTLTVAKKDMHIDATAYSTTFGDAAPAYAFTYRLADFVNSETAGSSSFTSKISNPPTCSSSFVFGNTSAGNAGTYPISCVLSDATTTPSLSTNYNFVAGTAVDLVVAKKDLHVDPTAFSITYGATNPVTADYAFVYRAADFASFETSLSTSFTGKISVAPTCGSDYSKGATGNGVVGAYAITCTTYATTPTPPASTNYRFVAGSAANLTVNKKQLRVDASAHSNITYGSAAPATADFAFTYRELDFTNGETAASPSFISSITTAPYCGSPYVATSDGRGDVGAYTISCTVTGSEAANYDFVAGTTNTLNVVKKNLRIDPDAKAFTYGHDTPETAFYTFAYRTGDFEYSETASAESFTSNLGSAPTCSTTYSKGTTSSGDAGNYPITCVLSPTSSSKNYNFVAGTAANLVVGKKEMHLDRIAKNLTYGADTPSAGFYTFTYRVADFANEEAYNSESFTSKLGTAPTCDSAFTKGTTEDGDAGIYPIFCFVSPLSSSTNYTFVLGSAANLVVAKKDMHIDEVRKDITYGDPAPEVGFAYRSTDFANSDTYNGSNFTSKIQQAPSCTVEYTQGLSESGQAGNYSIDCPLEETLATNYNFVEGDSANLVVAKQDMHIDRIAQDLVYGDDTPSAGFYTFTYNVDDFVNGEAYDSESFIADLIVAPTCGSSYVKGTDGNGDAGTYPITCVLSDAATLPSSSVNYNFVEGASADLTVAQVDLRVDADVQEITYGEDAPEYTFTFNADDFVNEENALSNSFKNSITGTPLCDSDYVKGLTVDGNAGSYPISCVINGSISTNYNFVVGAENTLTVNQQPLSVAANAKRITYGDSVVLDATYTGFVNDEEQGDTSFKSKVSAHPVCTSDYVPGTDGNGDAGSYVISCDVSEASATNYEFVSPTTANLTVDQKDLRIDRIAQDLVYGDDTPSAGFYTFTYNVDDFVNGEAYDSESFIADLIVAPTCGSSYVKGTDGNGDAGTYPITCVLSDAATLPSSSVNYNFVEGASADLTVAQVDLRVDADVQEITYGEDAPEYTFTFNADDFVNEENALSNSFKNSITGTPLCDSDYVKGLTVDGNAGSYPISCVINGSISTNYNFVVGAENTLTVNQQPLSVAANAKRITYGDSVVLDATYTGFVNDEEQGDTSFKSKVSAHPVCTSDYVPGTDGNGDAGSYVISCDVSEASATNYEFVSPTTANLTVDQKDLRIDRIAQDLVYGDDTPSAGFYTFTYNVDDFVNGEAYDSESFIADLIVAPTCGSSYVKGTDGNGDAGTYPITCVLSDAATLPSSSVNYNFVEGASADLTVDQKDLRIDRITQDLVYGDDTPSAGFYTFTYNVDDFVNGEAYDSESFIADLIVAPTCGSSYVKGTDGNGDAGTYPITCVLSDAATLPSSSVNYNFVEGASADLTVDQKDLRIDRIAQDLVYGDDTPSAGFYTFTYNVDDFVNGEAYDSESFIADLIVAPTCGSSYVKGTDGNGDAGTYPITCVLSDAATLPSSSVNYNFVEGASADLTVDQKDLRIDRIAQDLVYGDDTPSAGFYTFTYNVDDFVNGEAYDSESFIADLIVAPTCGSSYVKGTDGNGDAGTYPITCVLSDAATLPSSSVNYNFVEGASADLTVAQVDLRVDADVQEITYGEDAPEYTFTFNADDFVNEENALSNSFKNSITGTPLCDSDYVKGLTVDGNAGSYPISCVINGSISTNYNFVVGAENTLTVNQQPLSVAANAKRITYGDSVVLDATYTGFVNDEEQGDTSFKSKVSAHPVCTSDYVPGTDGNGDAGSYVISCDVSEASATNYEFVSPTTANLTVDQKDLRIDRIAQDLVYGDDTPSAGFYTFTYNVDDFVNGEAYDSESFIADLIVAPTCGSSYVKGTDGNGDAGTYPITCVLSDAATLPSSSVNYNFVEGASADLTVAQVDLRVDADVQEITYGEDAPEYTFTFNADDFVNEENALSNSFKNSITGTPLCDSDYVKGLTVDGNAGSYPISCVINGSISTNYNFVVGAENTLTVNQQPLSVAANAKRITYGDSVVLDATYTGFVNDEEQGDTSFKSKVSAHPVCTSDYVPGTDGNGDAGSYVISCDVSEASATNYEFVSPTTANLTVDQKDLRIDRIAQDLVYGDDTPSAGFYTFTYNVDDFVNGEAYDSESFIADLIVAPTCGSSYVKGTDGNGDAGTYPITCVLSDAATLPSSSVNYNFVEGASADLTVDQKDLRIDRITQDLVYGDDTPSAGFYTFTYNVDDFVNGEAYDSESFIADLIVAPTCGSSYVKGTDGNGDAGTYPITCVLSDAATLPSSSVNYNFVEGASADLTVDQKDLRIDRIAQDLVYGDDTPSAGFYTFTYNVDDFVNGEAYDSESFIADLIVAPTCGSSYVKGTDGNGDAGTYPITCVLSDAATLPSSSVNYNFVEGASADLTVDQKDLRIDRIAQDLVYGDDTPSAGFYTFTYNVDDFVNGEAYDSESFIADLIVAPTCGSSYVKGTDGNGDAGTYPITCVLSDAATLPSSSVNYNFVEGASADLTVAQVDLRVDADVQEITYGEDAPEYTFTFNADDFVNEENALSNSFKNSITGTPLCDSDYVKGLTVDGNAGSYPISCVINGSISTNYNFVVGVTAKLTVKQKSLTVTLGDVNVAYGETPVYDIAITGFIDGESETQTHAGTFTAPTCEAADYVAVTSKVADGPYTIECADGSATNYSFDLTDAAQLTVTKAKVALSADDVTRKYGQAAPATYDYTITGLVSPDTKSVFSGITCSSSYAAGDSVSISQTSAIDITCTGGIADNYEIDSRDAGQITITKRVVDIKVEHHDLVYGDDVPDLTYKVEGDGGLYAGGIEEDNLDANLTCHTESTSNGAYSEGNDVGDYDVICETTATAPVNYTINSITNAMIHVAPRTISIVAQNIGIEYGDPAPHYDGDEDDIQFTVGYEGIYGGETGSDLAELRAAVTCATDYAQGDPASVSDDPETPGDETIAYSVSCVLTSALSSNYQLHKTNNVVDGYIDGVLTVSPLELVITPDDATTEFLGEVPDLSEAFTTNLLPGDTLSANPTCTVPDYTPGDERGDYDIVCDDAEVNSNYYIGPNTYLDTGVLTVGVRAVTINVSAPTIHYGDAAPTTYTTSIVGDQSGVWAEGGYPLCTAGGAKPYSQGDLAANDYTIVCAYQTASADFNVRVHNNVQNVIKREIYIRAGAKQIHYGESATDIGWDVVTGGLGQQSIYGGEAGRQAVDSVVACSADGNYQPGNDVGQYDIFCSGINGASEVPGKFNLHFVNTVGNHKLNVIQRLVRVRAANLTTTYGDQNPEFVPEDANDGLFPGAGSFPADTLPTELFTCDVNVEGGYQANLDVTSVGNEYEVVCDGPAAQGNYEYEYVDSTKAPYGLLTVNQRPIDIYAEDATKVYGEPDPALEYHLGATQELVAGDTMGGSLDYEGSDANADGYDITSTLTPGVNYDVTFHTAKMVITQRPLSITVHDDTKVYGTAEPAINECEITVDENLPDNILIGTDALANTCTTSREPGANVGHYEINATAAAFSKGLPSNYDFTFVPGDFEITQRRIDIQADNATKTYGYPNPELTLTITSELGLVRGDSLEGSIVSTAEHVGSHHITQGTLHLSTNYDLHYTPGTMTITPLKLTVTPADATKKYGETDPDVEYTTNFEVPSNLAEGVTPITELVAGDVFAGAFTHDGIHIGDYDLTAGSFEVQNADGETSLDYELSFDLGAQMSITPAVLTVTPDPQEVDYRGAVPTYGRTVEGFVEADLADVVDYTPPVCTSDYATTTHVSSSPRVIYCDSGAAQDYTFDYKTANLIINPVELTVQPDNLSVEYRGDVTEYTKVITGFVGGEDAESADNFTAPSCDSDYTNTSHVAESPFTITCVGGTATDYTFLGNTAELTVTPAELTVTPKAASVEYGSEASYEWTVTGFVGGETETGVTAAAGYSPPTCDAEYDTDTHVSASPLTITCSSAVADDYTIDQSLTAELTITAAPLTVTPAAIDLSYGDPVPSYDFEVTGFKSSDVADTALNYVAPICDSVYAPGDNVTGDTPIVVTCDNASATDYTFEYDTANLNVAPVTLTVTPANREVAYGSNATYSDTVTGFVLNETAESADGYLAPQCAAIYEAGTHVSASPLTISCEAGDATNYIFDTEATALLTINPVTLTVTPTDRSVTYGAAATYDWSVTGFVHSETAETALNYDAPSCGSLQVPATDVAASPVEITCTGGSATDYTFNKTATAALTINRAPLEATANNVEVTYGDNVPSYSSSVTGFVLGQTTSNAAGYVAPTCASSYVKGTHQASSGLTISCHSASANNYSFQYNDGELTINKAVLTVTPGAATVTYGDDAVYTKSVTGFVMSENAGTALDYVAPTCAADYSVGTHQALSPLAITCVNGSAADYSFNRAATANLTITKRDLQLTVTNKTKVYGDEDPANLGACVVSAGSVSTSDELTGSCTVTRATGENVNTYTITPSAALWTSGTSADYNLTFVNGSLSITVRHLDITVASPNIKWGDAKPACSYEVVGLQFHETLLTEPTCTTDYVARDPMGTKPGNNYSVTYSGAVARSANYLIDASSYHVGTIHVDPAPVTVTADAKTAIFGAIAPVYTSVVSGVLAGDTLSAQPACYAYNAQNHDPYTITLGDGSTTYTRPDVGTYSIRCQGAATTDGHYAFTYVPAALTVAPKPITVTANAASAVYLEDLPDFKYTKNLPGEVLLGISCIVVNASAVEVGSHDITCSDPNHINTNYDITWVKGTLTINPKLILPVPDDQTVEFGRATSALTVSYMASIAGKPTVMPDGILGSSYTCSIDGYSTGSPVGKYDIACSGFVNPNFDIAEGQMGTLNVIPRTIYVKGKNTSITYGDAVPALTYDAPDIYSGQTMGNVFSTLPTCTTSYQQYQAVGTSDIVCSGAVLRDTNNYILVQGSSVPTKGTLTVGRKAVTVTADSFNKSYGDAVPTVGKTVVGEVAGHSNLAFSCSTTYTTTSNAGTTPATSCLTTTDDSNYLVTRVPGTVTVTARAVDLYAEAKSVEFGDPKPTFTYHFTNLPSGVTDLAGVSCPVTYTAGTTHASTKTITCYETANANYTVTRHTAVFTINPRAVTVTPVDQNVTFGTAAATLEKTVVNDYANHVTNNLSCNTTYQAGDAVGTKPINCSLTGAPNADYSVTLNTGTINIVAREVEVIGRDYPIIVGEPAPTYSYDVAAATATTGFINGASFTSEPVCTSTYTTSSDASSKFNVLYPVTCKDAAAPNYTFKYTAGAVTAQAILSPFKINATDVSAGNTIHVKSGVTSVTMDVATEITGASVTYTGNTGLVAGDNTVTITVKLSDGSTFRTYERLVVVDAPILDPVVTELTSGTLTTVNGETITTQTTTNSTTGAISLSGTGFTATLTGSSTDDLVSGEPAYSTSSSIELNLTGYAPNSTIKVYLFSTTTNIATLTTDATGKYVGRIKLPISVAKGRHTLQITGVATDKKVRSLNFAMSVRDVASKTATVSSMSFTAKKSTLSTTTKALLDTLAATLANKDAIVVTVSYSSKATSSVSSARNKAIVAYLKTKGVTEVTIQGAKITPTYKTAKNTKLATDKLSISATYKQ